MRAVIRQLTTTAGVVAELIEKKYRVSLFNSTVTGSKGRDSFSQKWASNLLGEACIAAGQKPVFAWRDSDPKICWS